MKTADDQCTAIRYVYALLDGSRSIRYVGETGNVDHRVHIHWIRRRAKDRVQRNPELQAWLTSLTAPPLVHILQVVPYNQRHSAETYWIRLLRSVPGVCLLNKYATPWGNGDRPVARGYVRTAEVRARMSEAKRGKPLTQEHRDKIAEAGRGRQASEATRKKISDALAGGKRSPLSDARRAQISEQMRGRVLSEETRRKISEAKKGKKRAPMTPDQLAHYREARRIGREEREAAREQQ